ncbi:MAG: hypothetical protein CK425_04890 [Parachlamydia sp.]|nr:MAG: hypothetical protein CK425_04890 [Parachlamydia sp.]
MFIMVFRPYPHRYAKDSSLARIKAACLQNAGLHRANIIKRALSRFMVPPFVVEKNTMNLARFHFKEISWQVQKTINYREIRLP